MPGAAALVVLVFAGCAGQEPHSTGGATAPSDQATVASRSGSGHATVGEQAAAVAVRQVGVPYRYGGNSTGGFDCSGLVYYAYARVGKQVPRTTAALLRQTEPVARNELRVGDLLFFSIAGKPGHVGMYLGNRRFVHAPSSGREVTVADLDSPFYRQAFIRGGRPL